jgi:filamentous hemagglutinin
VRELDPDWLGPDSAFPLDSIEGQLRHEEAVEQAAEARLAEILPRGFGTYENYAAFGQNLRDGLRSAGYHDVEPIFAGSAVSGRNFHTGQPFDVGRRSDYDIALASPTLMQRAIELGIPVRGVESRTRPLSGDDLNNLGLGDLAQRLSEQTGREVHFVIYRSRRAVARRGASRPILGE